MYKGYDLYFATSSHDVLWFPITPPEITIKVGSNNKVITLIDEGDVNVLKSPSLVEVEFDARFPMRQYPYAKRVYDFQQYWDKFKLLKENKTPFRFIVIRATPGGKRTWDTNLRMALEDMEIKESADEGDDVIISFKLRQYKTFGVKVLKVPSKDKGSETTSKSTSTSNTNRESKKTDTNQSYTVVSGDCLWNIAKRFYGNGAKYTKIYEANKKVIEETANKYRNGRGSSNGHWIYPGTKLIIPKL